MDQNDKASEPFPPASSSVSHKLFLKRTVCPQCGAVKARPSLTAYVYCDYCGTLADYDFQKACENPVAMPGPVYESLWASLQGTLEQAQENGDRKGYRAAQTTLYRKWVETCTNAIPPRAREPEYREKYISYMVEAAVCTAFDAEARRYEEEVTQASMRIQIRQVEPGICRVNDQAFERLSAAVFSQLEYYMELYRKAGVYDILPDFPSDPALLRRFSHSVFVQGWVPVLTDAQARNLLERTGLWSEYHEVTPAPDHQAFCGGCGIELAIPDGARRFVCEQCGFLLDASAPAVPCTGCGAPLTPPFDRIASNCPYCRMEIRRLR